MYNRDEETWGVLTEVGQEFLIECALAGKLTNYTSLDRELVERTGLPGFSFDRADERAAVGHLLYRIVQSNYPETKWMISALVVHAQGNDAGSGFYALAAEMDLLPKGASARQKEKFWADQVNGLFAHYGA